MSFKAEELSIALLERVLIVSAVAYGTSEGLRGEHHLAPPLMPASFADCACPPPL